MINQAQLLAPSPPFPQWSAFTLVTLFHAQTHLPKYTIQYRRWHHTFNRVAVCQEEGISSKQLWLQWMSFFLDLRSLQRSSHLPFYFPKYRANQRMKWTCVLPVQWFPAKCNQAVHFCVASPLGLSHTSNDSDFRGQEYLDLGPSNCSWFLVHFHFISFLYWD